MAQGRRPWRRAAWIAAAILVVVAALGWRNARDDGGPIDYSGPVADWPHWGGDEGGLRYSPLTQITPQNVGRLKVAWTYHTGPFETKSTHPLPALEATPLLADGRMYLCTASNKVIALDPETGREIWTYDPKLRSEELFLHNCRGVTYYRDPAAAEGSACAGRVLTATLDARLIALDAVTGQPCAGFGSNGEVDLTQGMGQIKPGEYGTSSPPVVVAGRIVVGSQVLDNSRIDAPAGVVRAFDLATGALAWAWNALPEGKTDADLAPAGETYARATSNAWSVFSADSERGLVFVPTGNTVPDHYGVLRKGADRYSSSVVALDGATGRVVWAFQTVHHDLWDYDVPAQPVLFDFPTAAGPVPALAQATKQGNIYILNRETGEPLVPVEERSAPQGGAVEGEVLAPTQPFPVNPAYILHPGDVKLEDVWGFTPWDRGKCRDEFAKYLNQGLYTPPSVQGSIMFPYNMGILNWGSVAIDPRSDVLVVNTSRILSVLKMWPREQADRMRAEGHFGVMPGHGTPFGYSNTPLLSPLGAPCNPPPWGTLAAIDMKAGKRLWEVTLGTTRDVAPFPFWLPMGAPSVGGPIVTASGVVFIAATTDNFIRAFDLKTGRTLWEQRLPAGGQATPMTYRLRRDGKQFVVIAAGGHRLLGTKPGDSLIAYTLED